MKTVAKIDPEAEYENAKSIIESAGKYFFNDSALISLDTSLNNIMTAARILIEREEKRRGQKKGNPKESRPKGRKKGEGREEVKKLPSMRYPNVEVREDIIFPTKAPHCPCCNNIMRESGLYDVTEKLEVIPKRYYIQRNKRPKFNCGNCHGAIVNTPPIPSIIPVSNYGDSLIIDVSLSKFCDLLPIERYVGMAFRNGLEGLPAQSLIGLTHHLADFLTLVYLKIKTEVLRAITLLADETTHKMLEGDETKNWYLWGFFSEVACYFETRNTRSGDVAFEFLKDSKAKFLVTDGYAGYGKAVKKIKEEYKRSIAEVNCNAHAIRYFKEASITWKDECAPFLKLYNKIYELERQRKTRENSLTDKEKLSLRKQMIPHFIELKLKSEQTLPGSMAESSFRKAMNYFLNHYDGLTLCTTNIGIPLDNNHSEREVRSPVVGRKTWYGTHSKQGALTTAIHFSIVQSCKVNGINPRNYYPWVVERILHGKEPLTPNEYSNFKETR